MLNAFVCCARNGEWHKRFVTLNRDMLCIWTNEKEALGEGKQPLQRERSVNPPRCAVSAHCVCLPH